MEPEVNIVNAPVKSAICLDVIVIGAGLSGLGVAIATALSGHRVTVFEAAAGLHEVGAGIQVTPNSSRILQRWGVSDELWASAAEPTYFAVRKYTGGILLLEKDFDKAMRSKYEAPFLELHRVDYQTSLYKRAKELGVQFRFGTRVAKVDFETGEVISQSGLRARGDLVVAADGLWSLCRAQFLPKDFEGVPRPTGDLAYRLTLKLDQIQDPELRGWVQIPSCNVWIGPKSHVVGYALRGGTEYNLVLITPDDLPSGVTQQSGDVEEMKALFKGWDPILDRFLAVASAVKKWKLMYREEMRRWVHESEHGNFVFVGDSCHPMLPYLGQGANLAIEDGAVLGRLLGHIQAKNQLGWVLRMHEQLRKPRADAVVKEVFQQRNVFHMVDGRQQQARDEILLSQVREGTEGEPFPIRWCCPRVQPWLFGYDAYVEVDKAVRENPLSLGENGNASAGKEDSGVFEGN
ncbi:FAD/NAD(P)-binding domain-containing protein [Durotheca rogersii]|uniref:FAD/NAD(P)-binding domain-containing protein n=1 Tax=Durotheca rogersii TaxID=419775 RepID=UPI0022204B07|nr:FAD/NAD(P)-binding domain-containing protein [Durotheca rogersii]KAI5866486.1 FAD/NAD(P)-binding domain-containing protein [Durotheca rogersii]